MVFQKSRPYITVLIFGAVIALVAVVPGTVNASSALGAMPILSAEEMNCADTSLTNDSGLGRSQAHAIAESLNRAYQSNTVKFQPNSFPHPVRIEGYVLAFCGVVRNGHRFIVVDGIYKFLDALVCDDAAGFGVVYDPQRRMFGDMTFGVSSCVPKKKKKQ